MILYLFMKGEIKLTEVMSQEYHYYQRHIQFYSTFFSESQVYNYRKLPVWILT